MFWWQWGLVAYGLIAGALFMFVWPIDRELRATLLFCAFWPFMLLVVIVEAAEEARRTIANRD